jgi:hypothetical protein
MLSISSYTQEYIDGVRAQIDRTVEAYDAVGASAPAAAREAFEPQLFNHLLLALDFYFGHRSRNMELKDGNALNEMRMVCTSLLQGDGRLLADKQIKLKPATRVLGLQVGDEIALDREGFMRLADAVYAEIAAKYPAPAPA